jgi:hypothetical protein
MSKKRSKKFWVIFWVISFLFLAGWYSFWNIWNSGFSSLNSLVSYLPFLTQEQKEKFKTLTYFTDYLMKQDNQEKVFLVLFQNNMELRPGGGYIGSFGILKMKNGKVADLQVHDLSNFDGRIPGGVEPPYPMKETLNVNSWKLRDSNYSPDFPTNARKAEEFYYMGKGEEKFDGIIAVNSNVLLSFLKVTGPVEIEGYPGTYDGENAIVSLEYQVEKAYWHQGIKTGERKSIMNPLAKEIIKKVQSFDNTQKIKLAEIILEDLNNKDIQLYFKDADLEEKAVSAKWAGNIDKKWNNDYLMVADANLGALKSDYYMKRSADYSVDLSGEKPKVKLKITYQHTAKEKDWMTNNYTTYLRVYVPDGAWLTDSKNLGEIRYGNEFGKKYFGSLITVPIGQTKTIEITYELPKELKENGYKLLVQKQSGSGVVQMRVEITDQFGKKEEQNFELKKDWKKE